MTYEMNDITDIREIIACFVERDKAQSECITRLEKENRQLREKLSRYERPKDSHNSSLPPSKDGLGKVRNLRRPTGRPSGGQTGHEGKTLEFRKPDRTVDVCSSYCRCCGMDLSGIEGELTEVRQQIDIPPVTPFVTEYRKLRKTCSCGHVSEGEFDPGITPGISYCPGIESWVAYLSVCQHIPYERLVSLLDEVCGLSLSQGTVTNILQRMEKRTYPAYEVIRERLSQSPVVGSDETSVSINGKNRWAWVWQNENLTYVTAGHSREKKNFNAVMPQGMPKTILVTDCLSSYFSQDVAHHQICTSRILRELIYLSEIYDKHAWSEGMASLIRQAIHSRKATPGKLNISDIKSKLKHLFDEVIDAAYPKIITLQKRLRKYQDYLFCFLENEKVPPDNNASERAIRCFKIKVKVSGFFKSEGGAQRFAQLHSIADTARKNGSSPLLVFATAAKFV